MPGGTTQETVAREWAEALAGGDVERAVRLVAPEASLHAEGAVLTDPARIRSYLARSNLLGASPTTTVADDGDGAAVTLRWEQSAATGLVPECHLRIADGLVTEMRIAELSTTEAEGVAGPIEVSAAGEVSDADRAHAAATVGRVLGELDAPVLAASVRLERSADPARERPVIARVNIDMDGERVRAHVAAPTATEAVDALGARLRDRLEHLASHRRALRRRGPSGSEGEWRHGDLPGSRDPVFPRPVEERQIVRHKTFTTSRATIDEAAFDLEALDYDFLLFTDLASASDALIHRLAGGTYGLQFVGDGPPSLDAPTAAVVSLEPAPAPTLSTSDARVQLEDSDERWLFFADAASGRGHVLYRRLDGHYGLLAPRDAPDGA